MLVARSAVSATRDLAQNFNAARVSAVRVAALRFDSSPAARVAAFRFDFSSAAQMFITRVFSDSARVAALRFVSSSASSASSTALSEHF